MGKSYYVQVLAQQNAQTFTVVLFHICHAFDPLPWNIDWHICLPHEPCHRRHAGFDLWTCSLIPKVLLLWGHRTRLVLKCFELRQCSPQKSKETSDRKRCYQFWDVTYSQNNTFQLNKKINSDGVTPRW